jgi:hypothetical protein
MLIRWCYDCPKLKGFYFEMWCERLFGYLSSIGSKDRKTHNVMKTLISFLVVGANTKNKSNIMSMWLYCTFLIYKLFHLNVIIMQIILHVHLFKQSYSHFVMYCFIQSITLSKLNYQFCKFPFNRVLFHSSNHIFALLYIVSFNQSHCQNWIINFASFLSIVYYFIQAITSSLCYILFHSIKHIITYIVSHSINHIITWIINFVIFHPILSCNSSFK